MVGFRFLNDVLGILGLYFLVLVLFLGRVFLRGDKDSY